MRTVVSRGTGKPRQKTLRALVTLALWQMTTGKATNTVLEIALTVDNAAALGAHIGSTYTIDATEITTAQGSVPPMISLPITLKVVGILQA
ncbi:MAG TPA: hypothetical protein VII61_17425 [Ktedonobacteraceae bacterium]